MKVLISSIFALCAICSPAFGQVLGGASAGVELTIGVKGGVGVRGAEKQPDVDFLVVQPNGDKSEATAIAPYNGERPGTASYPTDFTNAGRHPGKYTWQARVDGKVLASGVFFYKPVKGGFMVLTPY
jgi:hypothetical protein